MTHYMPSRIPRSLLDVLRNYCLKESSDPETILFNEENKTLRFGKPPLVTLVRPIVRHDHAHYISACKQMRFSNSYSFVINIPYYMSRKS